MHDPLLGGYAGWAGHRRPANHSQPVSLAGLVCLILLPDVEGSPDAVFRPTHRFLLHLYKFFGIVFAAHSSLQQLDRVKLNEDIAHAFRMPPNPVSNSF